MPEHYKHGKVCSDLSLPGNQKKIRTQQGEWEGEKREEHERRDGGRRRKQAARGLQEIRRGTRTSTEND